MITAINEKYIVFAGFIKQKRKKGKDRWGKKVIKGEKAAAKGGRWDTGQHRKFRAKFVKPLGGRVELREGKDSFNACANFMSKQVNCKKTYRKFLILQTLIILII